MKKYNALVLPVHGNHLDNMTRGFKNYEIRTYDFKKINYPALVYLHITKRKKHPLSGYIAASFVISKPPMIVTKEIINDRVVTNELLRLAEEASLSIKELREVTKEKDARFIRITDYKCLKNPVKLQDIGLKVPQSFMYLFDEQVKRIKELEGVPF